MLQAESCLSSLFEWHMKQALGKEEASVMYTCVTMYVQHMGSKFQNLSTNSTSKYATVDCNECKTQNAIRKLKRV